MSGANEGRRLELLRSVMTDLPECVRGLADRLDRNVSDVHEDVQLLAEYDIFHLEDVRRAKRPVVPYGEIVIEMCLSPPEGQSDQDERTESVP